jgi:hypothetical protein
MNRGALRKPEKRVCERCGRHEEWDAAAETWAVAEENGTRTIGSVFCIHEWDINGAFSPFEDS